MSTPARNRTQRPNCRRCTNCSILLTPNLRRYTFEELNEQIAVLLRTWITPTSIALEDIICVECYLLLQERVLSNAIKFHEDMSPAYGHLNICFGCGISIASRRTHKVPLDCPQRSTILRWTPAHLVARLERVCIACWLASTRESRQLVIHDPSRPDNVTEKSSPTVEKSVDCKPPPMSTPINQSPNSEQVPRLQPAPKVKSRKYKRVAAASRHCIFIGCHNIERLLVPMTIKEVLLLRYNIYVPLCARICHYHLNNNQWDELMAKYNDFTGVQMDDLCSILERALRSCN